MKIIFWNVNSYWNNFGDLDKFAELDFVFLCETWLTEDVSTCTSAAEGIFFVTSECV